MTKARLCAVSGHVIRPFGGGETKAAVAALREIAAAEPSISTSLAGKSDLSEFLTAAFSLSPFLRETALLSPATLVRALSGDVDTVLQDLVDRTRVAWSMPDDPLPVSETVLMARLRLMKRDFAFLLALADLGRLHSARDTTRFLSAFADAAVSAAIGHLLRAGHDGGKLRLADPSTPALGSGLIVLGMGKHGGRELNYSSDIDIVVFYDPETGVLADPADASETYGRMMRRLVRILQDRTGEGYVFRTDLRLRPDPGSTPLAVSVDAALTYYEGRGQNWERAAYIKARPVAGDLAAGEDFLRQLTPFVFRKYLDYAAIADIHSIKRQIHAHKGLGAIAVKGHDVKLGHGGIREIEFFVQTQQLIAGGRMPDLRSRETETALAALASARWISPEIAGELTECYWFLRDIEHRIQMVRDEQSHRLPETDAELKRIALMAGFADVKGFSTRMTDVLKRVETRYGHLFEQEADLTRDSGAKGAGNLVFTGQQDDPETLATLQSLGFSRPADMSRIIRTWHSGRYRATQSAEARERLTALMPALLKAFGESRRADEALLRFDDFLRALPAGIQLFSLIGSNPPLLSLLVTIMASAPRLAHIIAARPHVFDGMLDPTLLTTLPDRAHLSAALERFVAGSRHYEERLDRLRIVAAEQRFLIGVRLLTGSISGAAAARAFTDLADLLIEAALKAVIGEVETVHGPYPTGSVTILGMGKLGSFEMTAGSDVDLILLYDHDDEVTESTGERQLDPQRYFTRLTQRLVAALSAPTAEGIIFEVDLRLRPSGNKGPVATRISAFRKYQAEEAWTWEHMALTRARIVCGDVSLEEEARAVITDILSAKREPARIAADVAEMRSLIGQEKPPKNIWDLKLIDGGLVDIEFIAQFLRLVRPVTVKRHDTYGASTGQTLRALAPGFISASDLDLCLEALTLFTELSQITRLCVDGIFDPEDAPTGLIERICRAGDCPDIGTLEGEVKRLSLEVRRIFEEVVKAG